MKPPIPQSLRLCFLSQRLPRSGGHAHYGYLWPLCKNLAARGHDITVITSEAHSDATSETIEGVQIHNLDSPIGEFSTTLQESVLDRLEQLHLEKPFDLVHSVDRTGHYLVPHKKELGVTLASDIAGIKLDRIFGLLGMTEDTVVSYLHTSAGVTARFLKSFFGEDRRLLNNSDGVFVASKQQKDILELYYFVPSRKVYVVPYGINAPDIESPQPKENPFEKLGIAPGTKVILTVTPLLNVEETKNLLTAFERVVIKKPSTALVIVGEGHRRKELEFNMLSLALASKTWFTGNLPDNEVESMIRACDIYVNLSSRSAGFEGSVLEAMACRKVVIASEVGTSGNVITNGVDGFLLRPTEIVSLTRLLLEAVSGLINIKVIGDGGREKILKMFDTKAMVDETIRAYHGILKSTGKYSK